jgi:AcrR family transcriptional regulator
MVKRNTKDRVVEAAVRLFNERGTAAVSTNHIAEEAGISPGNLYYHFRNKEEIIRAIFARMMAAWEAMGELPQERAPTLADLQEILEVTYSVLWEYRFFYREFVALLRRDPELGRRYREVRERGLANTELLLESFVASGVLREPEDRTVVPELAKLFWLIVEFWLPFVEMGEEAVGLERSQEGVGLMMRVLKPYMTEEALDELGPARREVHEKGDKS